MLLLGLAEATSAQGSEGWLITTAHGVILRSGPSQEAGVIRTIPIATVLAVRARSESRDRIGRVEAHWYKVDMTLRARHPLWTGWVFGGLAVPYDPDDPFDALWQVSDRAVARSRDFPDREHSFRSLIALENTIIVAYSDVERPEFEVMRLEVIDAAARTLAGTRGGRILYPVPDDPLFESWLIARRHLLEHSYFGGFWFVHEDVWRSLHEKHLESHLADRIAWRASTPRAHDCEDGPDCYLQVGLDSVGKYLILYPQGEFAEKAASLLKEYSGIAARYACWNEETGQPLVSRELLQEIVAIARNLDAAQADPLVRDAKLAAQRCGVEIES